MPFPPRVLTLGEEKALKQLMLPLTPLEPSLLPFSDLPTIFLSSSL